MGNVLRVLGKVVPKRLKGLFHDSMRFESSECMHIHWRNLRIVMTTDQFHAFTRAGARGAKRWSRMGSPADKGDIILNHSNVSGETLLGDTIAVEVNGRPAGEPDHIHVHYKDLRLEMLDDEFLEFADCLTMAAANLRKYREETT